MIEATLRYTPELYKDYTWFYLFRGKYFRFGIRMFTFLTVMALILLIYEIKMGNGIELIPFFSIALAACIGLYIFALTSAYRFKKLSPALFQSEMHFAFDADRFTVNQSGNEASGTSTVKYEVLHRVYETRKVFYIFISPNQAYILPKDKIIKGSREELRGLFQLKLDKKFILCK